MFVLTSVMGHYLNTLFPVPGMAILAVALPRPSLLSSSLPHFPSISPSWVGQGQGFLPSTGETGSGPPDHTELMKALMGEDVRSPR